MVKWKAWVAQKPMELICTEFSSLDICKQGLSRAFIHLEDQQERLPLSCPAAVDVGIIWPLAFGCLPPTQPHWLLCVLLDFPSVSYEDRIIGLGAY